MPVVHHSSSLFARQASISARLVSRLVIISLATHLNFPHPHMQQLTCYQRALVLVSAGTCCREPVDLQSLCSHPQHPSRSTLTVDHQFTVQTAFVPDSQAIVDAQRRLCPGCRAPAAVMNHRSVLVTPKFLIAADLVRFQPDVQQPTYSSNHS
jgi:hypothetical protein